MKIQIAVAIDNFNQWRAEHSEMRAIHALLKETPYHRARRVSVSLVNAEVTPPPLPEKVDGEVPFCRDTQDIKNMVSEVLARYRNQ